MEILYIDNHLLALNKPAGLLTQPSGQELPSLEEQAKEWIKEQFNKPGAVFLHALHRLDRVTSGIVLFARTSKALTKLNAALRQKQAKKTYLALVEKPPKQQKATLIHSLIHGAHHAQIVKEGGKEAKLHYTVLKQEEKGALLEVSLETGRYHQIRAQLSSIGCPIRGDKKYGAKTALAPHTIALHHVYLEILHPTKKEWLTIQAPLPPVFQPWLEREWSASPEQAL